MTLIPVDYFKNGKNLFPTEGITDPHLADLIRELQRATSGVGIAVQVLSIGAEAEYSTVTAGLTAIADSAVNKPYLLLLEPGVTTEDVTLKPYTFLAGRRPAVTTLSGRVIGPASGIAGVLGMTVSANTAAPAVDLAAGTLRLVDVSVRNDGVGQSIRVTGGKLEYESGKIERGPIQVTGGEAAFGVVDLLTVNGSTVSGGLCRFGSVNLVEAFAGYVFTVNGGTLEIGHARVSNTLGGVFSVTSGLLRYATLLERGLLAGSLAIKATGGTIEAGLRNFALGVKATGYIEIVNNVFDSGDKVTVNGVDFEQGVHFTVGGSALATALNLKNAINASVNPLILGKLTAVIDGGVPERVNITASEAGTNGNLLTLAETDGATNNFTLSGATLTGGLGLTDIAGATIQNLLLGL